MQYAFMLHGSSSTPPQCPGHRSCVAAWAAGWELVGPGGAGLTYAATQHTISCEFAAEQDRGHWLPGLALGDHHLHPHHLHIESIQTGTVLRTAKINTFVSSFKFTITRVIIIS